MGGESLTATIIEAHDERWAQFVAGHPDALPFTGRGGSTRSTSPMRRDGGRQAAWAELLTRAVWEGSRSPRRRGDDDRRRTRGAHVGPAIRNP
jgi:ribosomal protein S6E (S10)